MHNYLVDRVGLREITDWSVVSVPELSLPKSYLRLTYIMTGRNFYLKLYPNLQSEDIEFTLIIQNTTP